MTFYDYSHPPNIMRKNSIQICFILMLLITSVAQSETIKSIEISGLNAISRGTVLSYLPVEVGDDYTQNTSAQIIRALYKTQFFKDIEVAQKNQVLKIDVQENPHIKYVDLLNYTDKVLDKERINETLQAMGLSKGKIFNKRRLEQLVNQLEAAYIAKGYYNAKITKTVEIDLQNRVGIELDFYEGEVARINTIKITGNKIYDEDDLLDLFNIGEADFFIVNYFTEKDHYSKIELDAGIEAMRSFYINLGYLDFKVSNVETNLSDNKQRISINIQVVEGPQYQVGNIQFTGDLLDKSVKELKDLFALKKGDVFERKQVIKGVNAVTNIFTDQGYAFAEIDPITSEDRKNHRIDLNVKVSLNKKVYINRITIAGNTRTQDHVIRREIGIAEGGLYSNSELDNAIKKIKRLGFFSDVKMVVSKIKNFNDKINLHFTVEETKTGQFSIGLSHSNEIGVAFNLGIQENNFLGTGNVLNANITNSEAVQEVSFFFSDPYFTEDKHSISYGIFTKSVDGAELDVSSYKIDENGGSIGYGIPITEDTRISTNLRVSKRDITCGETFATINEPVQCTNGDEIEVKIRASWSNNTLNNFRFATEGQQNVLSLNVATPIGDFRYYKIDASHKSYYPITKKLTFNVKGKVGIGSGYGDKELPFFERYYGGGSSSVRGFDFNSLGPTYADGNAQGGDLSLLGSTAVISTLDFIGKKAENMRISAFVDVGSISIDLDDIDIRSSAGVAFNWLTPLGTIGLYAATPILKEDDDKITNFDFTLGTSF